MDHLTDLLNHAASAETPGGDQRVQELIGKIRDTDDVDLSALETTAQEKFEELHNGGEYDPDHVANLEALADIVDAARTLGEEQRRVQEERDAKVNALAERIRTPDADETGDDTENDSDSDATSEDDPEGGEETPQPEEPTAAPNEDGSTTSPVPADTHQRQTEPAKQPVAASGGARPSTASALSATRTQNPAPREEKKPVRSITITAAAEVPDTPFGKQLSQSELAEAALNRYATFPEGQPTNGPLKANVGRINRQFSDEFKLTGSEMGDRETIDSLANETRLPGGSLVAAAQKNLTAAAQAPSTYNDVWCSVSETDWTLCPPLATTSGMLDLPTSAMPRRGGLRYPVWSQFPDAEQDGWHGTVVDYPDTPADPGEGLDNPGYFHSKDSGGLGNIKECLSGPCVDWREVRQSISYLCVTSDILRDRTFPELTERFISDVLVKHQHYLNAHYIKHVYDRSDKVDDFNVADAIGSTAEAVLDYIPLLVTWFRNAYRMEPGATLEIVAPVWFREFLKRDLERKSNRPHGMVTDAEVQALFSSYASRVQWVYDWQDLPSKTGGSVSGKVMPVSKWPDNVELLAYPAGSWVLFQGNILNLGVQYDYQLLQENRYSAMFTEDSWMLLNRCDRSFKLKLTNLCANGAVGPNRDACPSNDGPEPVTVVSSEKDPVYTKTVADKPAENSKKS